MPLHPEFPTLSSELTPSYLPPIPFTSDPLLIMACSAANQPSCCKLLLIDSYSNNSKRKKGGIASHKKKRGTGRWTERRERKWRQLRYYEWPKQGEKTRLASDGLATTKESHERMSSTTSHNIKWRKWCSPRREAHTPTRRKDTLSAVADNQIQQLATYTSKFPIKLPSNPYMELTTTI